MRYVVTIVVCIVGLALVLGIAASGPDRSSLQDEGRWPTGEAVINLPGDDDEDCDGPGSDDETDDTPGCFISKAVVDLAEPSILTLEGRFCDEPGVYLGSAGGTLQQLSLLNSGASFLQADLAPWDDPATRIVVVTCPCGDCAMDVTIGAQGPVGPTGPTGPAGEIPAGLGSLQLMVQSSPYYPLDEEMTCVFAECPPDRVVTGGGFLIHDTDPSGSEPGFEVAAAGPLVPEDGEWHPYEPPVGQPWPASQRWTVCGTGSPGLHLMVRAICLGGSPSICGDGQISPPEVCETHEDCEQLLGPYSLSQCVDCACKWCGDGVVTPPEMCETDGDCGYGNYCESCSCVDNPYGDGGFGD